MITYLVSGDDDISPSHANLRRSGRRVRFDREVSLVASQALLEGRRYVVVTHGRKDGTVTWFDSNAKTRVSWLWVGMAGAPRRVCVYLYACNAGVLLSRHLRHSECFGHCAPVPMPTGWQTETVLDFLTQVDRLVGGLAFDPNEWKRTLSDYVNDEWERELDNPTHDFRAPLLQMLSKALSW